MPLFPSITTGPDEVSELADPDGVGVGDVVLVAVGAGVGEGLVALGAALGSFVALGELLVAGIVVALGAGAVLGFDVGVCVVDGAVAGGVAVVDVVGEAAGVAVADGVAVVDVVGEAVGVAVADGVAVVDVVGEAVGVAVAPLLATVKYPTTAGPGAVRPGQHDSKAVRSVGKLRSVVRNRRAVVSGTREVERWISFGSNPLRPPPAVQVEIDRVEVLRVPHEDVDLSLHRRAVESHRIRPIWVHAQGEPRFRRSRGGLHTDAAQCEGNGGNEREQYFAAQRQARPTWNHVNP